MISKCHSKFKEGTQHIYPCHFVSSTLYTVAFVIKAISPSTPISFGKERIVTNRGRYNVLQWGLYFIDYIVRWSCINYKTKDSSRAWELHTFNFSPQNLCEKLNRRLIWRGRWQLWPLAILSLEVSVVCERANPIYNTTQFKYHQSMRTLE